MTGTMTTPNDKRMTFRLTREDEDNLAAFRTHLRITKEAPWANRTDTIRAALKTAAQVIAQATEVAASVGTR